MAVVKYFNNLWKGKIDFFTKAISSVSILMGFWISLVVLELWFFSEKRVVLVGQVLLVTFLHFLISELFFKYILPRFVQMRERPFDKYPDEIAPIGYKLSYGSMPSSHMSSSVAMLVVLVSNFSALLWPAVAVILFMAFARLHNGMHYPSDILVGIILGFFYGMTAVWIF